MKIIVDKDTVKIIDKPVIHKGEYNVHNCKFEFTGDYDGLVKMAVFRVEYINYTVDIIDNVCNIPSEVLTSAGNVVLGVYAYAIENEELRLRFSPIADSFPVGAGSYVENGTTPVPATPSQYELYSQALNEGLEEAKACSEYAKGVGDKLLEDKENGVFDGKDGSELTEEDYKEIENNVLEDIQPMIDEANEKSQTAINISKGANQSVSFGNYETMVTAFNNFPNDLYNVGQNVMIVTLNVPDLWISAIEEIAFPYIYINDDNFISELQATGKVQVGHYVLSALETQKVDLTEYVKNTDYPTSSKSGVVKIGSTSTGLKIDETGLLLVSRATDTDIDNRQSANKPIVPANLDYAVKSVVGGHITLTQAEYDALETKNENTYYYIKEEE